MDIVHRLRQFMNIRKISVTQFADTCGIPRPSLSQLLNGRNKKVSDEIISKIHEAYPSLNVMWLMFGEGDMTTDTNIKTSEPQNSPSLDFDTPQQATAQPDALDGLFSEEALGKKSVSYEATESTGDSIDFTEEMATTPPASKETTASESTTATITFSNTKRVVSIIVMYSDNTVESFVPAGR